METVDLVERLRTARIETVKAALRKASRFIAYSTHLPRAVNAKRSKSQPEILFVWIPKSAGTSMYAWLRDEIGMLKLKEPSAVRGGFAGSGPVTFGHMDINLLVQRGLVQNAYLDRAFKFAIARNPFSRALSLYSYLKRRNRVHGSFSDFLSTVAKGVEPLGLYNSRGLSQANPQTRWIKRVNGTLLIDRFWKLEDLAACTPDLRACLGANGEPPVLNRSRNAPDAAELLRAQDVDLIRKIYRDDFEFFEYSDDPERIQR